MELAHRITWIDNAPRGGGLIAADTTGRLHRLDDDLVVQQSSPVRTGASIAAGAPIYTMAVTDRFVVTKDKLGTIVRWDVETLDPIDVLDAAATCRRDLLDEDEVPSHVMSRGIAVLDGKVYLNNGFRQLVTLDLDTFAVLSIEPSISGDNPVECINVDSDVHVISDQAGRLFFGDLTTMTFPGSVSLEAGNIHSVQHDHRWNRFWATLEESDDSGRAVSNGLVVLSPEGELEHRLLFALDDVEVVALDQAAERVYCGGFDGELQVIDNAEKPEVARTLRGFTHQIITMSVLRDGTLAILTQDGALVRLTDTGTVLAQADFRRQCAWDIQPVPGSTDRLYVACDDGVRVLGITWSGWGPVLSALEHHPSDVGFYRRLSPLPDGYVTISRAGALTRHAADGTPLWREWSSTLLNDIAISPDGRRVLVAANSGGSEHDLETGDVVDTFDVDGLPVWAATYLDDGERVLITRDGRLRTFAATSHDLVWRLDMGAYPKRAWVEDGTLWVSGEHGAKALTPFAPQVGRRYDELLYNTVENAVSVDGMVFAGSYGMQVGAFDAASAELIGLVEDFGDFVKSLAVVRDGEGTPFLIVGGRGPVLTVFGLDAGPERGTLVKLRETHLPRSGLGAVTLTSSGLP